MRRAVIVDAVRTPTGKRNGLLSGWHPADLAATVLTALADRNDLDPSVVDDVIMGCVHQVGAQGLNVGRNAVLAAGWPESVPATTIDRQCGSSQQAIHFGAQGVMTGAYDVVVAGGVESMSLVPMGSIFVPGLGHPFEPSVMDRYADRENFGQHGIVNQGLSAELLADRWRLTREQLDAFALESQGRAKAARDEGRFAGEIVSLETRRRDPATGEVEASGELVTSDGGIGGLRRKP